MLVPILWLKDYTEVPDSIETFCERMIMSGSNLETVQNTGQGIEGVLVGKICKIDPHPNADKLVICQVDIGEAELRHIVTGAKNVYEGALVPVALAGARIPGPLHGQAKIEGGVLLEKGEIRGILSDGMLCSCSELGFEDKVVPLFHRDGIWILNDIIDEPIPGSDFVETMGLKNQVVDFEITPNRPDCLSMIGMAREVGATFQKSVNVPPTKINSPEGKSRDYIEIEIKNPHLCRRYVARIVSDVQIKQSPWWLQKRLMLAGMRPINNIVDITNFVMLEFGEPIHAFDIRQIEGGKIVVDTSLAGEVFTTLDGVKRDLPEDTLMIKDGQKSLGIAGIMGGLNSEIVQDTKTILIEGANFDPDSIRASSKKMGLRTEASSRFEKGLDANLCKQAVDRVASLMEELGAGKVMAHDIDQYPSPMEAKACPIRVSRISSIMGVPLTSEQVKNILLRLQMDVSGEGDTLIVRPPSVRQDLEKEIDYVEEVARIYGYDQLPVTVAKGNSGAEKTEARRLIDLTKETLCALGVNEIQTYSFVSPKGLDMIGLSKDAKERDFIPLINPLGEENSVMRTLLTPNMLEVLARNYNRNIESARAFELGNTFHSLGSQENDLPLEELSLALGCYGENESFFTLKGIISELLIKLGIPQPEYQTSDGRGTYHPGRCADILLATTPLGIIGEIHPEVAKNSGITTKVYIAELSFEQILKEADTMRLYKPLAKYPATDRDIALLVKEDTQVGDLERIIKAHGTELLESVQLFDVYRGNQVEAGKKSCAFNLVYRAKDRTLKEEEVNSIHQEVLNALKEDANAVLREM
ncbi:MAG: phenylalanine--tRNA ligase subunit beta [Anaerovoracaceae bacterium]|jgi:phenylalanyl-tRNA synthetase beta chain|nr:phenylalanine--tRNA ligase subunit beta [Anaerovoracaceae bacterium]